MLDEVQPTINRLLAILTERELWVIRMRFGLETGQPMLLEDVAKVYPEGKVTRERVRQIEARALQKMRKEAGDLTWANGIFELLPYIKLLRAVKL